MAVIITLLKSGLLVWMALLVALIAVRILKGDINARGILLHRADDPSVKPERALSAAVFPLVIISYAYSALSVDPSLPGPVGLPNVPESLLNLLIGTNGLYLAGKIARG
jgi:hypothetical protein